MIYLESYNSFNQNGTLIVVDVQKSFKKFFSQNYVEELKKYCQNFSQVYQIFDNHNEGKDVDLDYLYDEHPDTPVTNDLYEFPNQKGLIEKRYNYDVDIDFYKKIVTKETYDKVKSMELNKSLSRGMMFPTNQGTVLVYIGNNHQWFHVPKKLYELFKKLKGQTIHMAGGSRDECFLDVEATAKSMGVDIKIDYKYTYSANGSLL